MNRWTMAVAFLLVFGIALAACAGANEGPSFEDGGPCPNKPAPAVQGDVDMTVEELTDLVAEAITCPGYAFHMRSAGDTESGPYSSYTETEAWIDMQRGVGRVEQLFRPTSDEALAEVATATAGDEEYSSEFRSTRIVRNDGSYSSQQGDQQPDKRRPPGCHGPGRESLGLVLPCSDGPLQDFEFSIYTNTSYNSQETIAYVAVGESRGSDETYLTTTRTFFDPATLLPMGQVVEGTLDIGEIYPIQADIEFQHEFVPLDSLPDDFFDPASIGYVETDLEEPLDDAEIAVYWLGREFEGRDEYPALAIRHATARPRSQTGGGSVAQIAYRSADDEFGRIWVRIDLFAPEAFEFRDGETVLNLCEETIDNQLADGQATIRRHYNGRGQNPDGSCNPPDRYSAVVRFDDVVVEIDAPSTGNGRERFLSPYDTEAAMELLIRSLELRE